MSIHKQRIGIWGLGAVGQAALRFFKPSQNPLEILDLKDPQDPFFANFPAHITYTHQSANTNIHAFFERNDAVLVSPGIDTTPYLHFEHKFINELDLVWQQTKTPIIGITGTIGKTTVTTLLSHYLRSLGLTIGTGGNIGTPMLDLLEQACTHFVFELSSFQLEYTRFCAPELAVWTNFYPNHLDRHQTLEDYFLSKLQILRHQTCQQKALIPLSLAPLIKKHTNDFHDIRSQLCFFSPGAPTPQEKALLPQESSFFYFNDDEYIVTDNKNTITSLLHKNDILIHTYPENLLILAAALYCLHQPLTVLTQTTESNALEHRLEFVAIHNNAAFYNDSKSTIMQATHAAVHALSGKNVILLLGGLSKGVNRIPDIQKLFGKVCNTVCFGKEASQLHVACYDASIPSAQATTLEEAFIVALRYAQKKENACILLSPGGSSYDLFSNYIERGNRFKDLVVHHTKDT